jgi:hypothetical protein
MYMGKIEQIVERRGMVPIKWYISWYWLRENFNLHQDD